MGTIKVKTPAKINLTLEILNKRDDGFHNIQSIMQTVSVFDHLKINVEESNTPLNIVKLDGNNDLIPYDDKNIVFTAIDKYLKYTNISSKTIKVFIDKNIPVAAGLAGGSSNAAGALLGINKIFNEKLSITELDKIASELGSDVNFCLHGGTQLATSRGEILKKLSTPDFNVILIKPKDLFISAKEAYQGYAALKNKNTMKNTEKMIRAIEDNNIEDIAALINNDLEASILPNYNKIAELKSFLMLKGALNSIMSGSGPTVFGIFQKPIPLIPEMKNNDVFVSKTIKTGVEVCN